MAISWIQPSFAGGEIGPSLYGRIDMAKYQVALRKCDNFIVRQYGGVENRPGTRFVGAAKYPNRKCRLIPFQFSTVQTYALEFGHQYMRVIKDGALVLNSSNVIYEIATPYTEADLFRIKFTQSADVLTLVHPAYPPKELRRYAHDNWQLVDVVAKWLTSMMCWIDRQLLLMLFLGWRLVVSADLLTLAASLQAHQIFHQLILMLHWRRMPLIMLKLILLPAFRSTCFRVIRTFRLCEKPCLMLARGDL